MLPNTLNRYRAWAEFAAGKAVPDSKPTNLSIGLTNHCNFHCVYCDEHRPGNKVPRASLEGAVYEDLIALVETSHTIAWHGISEFFLDRRFFELVERSGKAGALLSLNTNGSVFTERHLEALATYPAPINLNFSLDAASADVYKAVRGFDFDRVIANIRRYLAAMPGRPSWTWTSLSYVITKTNVHEMVPFVQLAKELGIKAVVFYRLHAYEGMNWKVQTAAGTEFDYKAECVENVREVYNDNVRRADALAKQLGLHVTMPAELPSHG